jgi:hypothetical protein
VAFLKFARDKRGYEHFYLLQPSSRGKARPQLLYWYRTPPNVRVGRAPFDPEIQRALETNNPGVAFDWKAIAQTPIPPPPEMERWRERRRLERSMRAAARMEDADAPVDESPGPAAPSPQAEEGAGPRDGSDTPDMSVGIEAAATDTASGSAATSDVPAADGVNARGASRARRRRRRRRGRRWEEQGPPTGADTSPAPGSSARAEGSSGAEGSADSKGSRGSEP